MYLDFLKSMQGMVYKNKMNVVREYLGKLRQGELANSAISNPFSFRDAT